MPHLASLTPLVHTVELCLPRRRLRLRLRLRLRVHLQPAALTARLRMREPWHSQNPVFPVWWGEGGGESEGGCRGLGWA